MSNEKTEIRKWFFATQQTSKKTGPAGGSREDHLLLQIKPTGRQRTLKLWIRQ